MKVLNVNKTKMYKLVSEKSIYLLPKMKFTEFSRSPITYGYSLNWNSVTGDCFEAYLSCCFGVVILLIICIDDSSEKHFILDIEYLQKLDLLKEKNVRKEKQK